MPRERLMRLALKLMAGLYDVRDGDIADRVITTAARLTPSA